MLKIAAILGVLLIVVALAWKHEIYQSGIKDASLKYTAEAAERSIKSERLSGRALAVSERIQAEGEATVDALRIRAAHAETDAKAAREAHLAIAAGESCPRQLYCPVDLPVRQP